MVFRVNLPNIKCTDSLTGLQHCYSSINSNCILNVGSEYVPLASALYFKKDAIKGPQRMMNLRFQNYMRDRGHLDYGSLRDYVYNLAKIVCSNTEELEAFYQSVPELLELVLNSAPYTTLSKSKTVTTVENGTAFYSIDNFYGRHVPHNYNDIIMRFCSHSGSTQGNIISDVHLRRFSYSVMAGMLWEGAYRHDVGNKILAAIVVKREALEYFRYCSILGEAPHRSTYELWLNEEIFMPGFEGKGIRKALKDTATKWFGGVYETKSNEDMHHYLIKGIYKPREVNTIKKKQEWVESLVEEACSNMIYQQNSKDLAVIL